MIPPIRQYILEMALHSREDYNIMNRTMREIKFTIDEYIKGNPAIHGALKRGYTIGITSLNDYIAKHKPGAKSVNIDFTKIKKEVAGRFAVNKDGDFIIELPNDAKRLKDDSILRTVRHEVQHYIDKLNNYPNFRDMTKLKKEKNFLDKYASSLYEVRAYATSIYNFIPKKEKLNEDKYMKYVLLYAEKNNDFIKNFYLATKENTEKYFINVTDILIDQFIQEGRWEGDKAKGYTIREIKRQIPVISHRIWSKIKSIFPWSKK